jgi:hypothetical protein
VLEGNSTATKGKKVLNLTPSDNLFIFFSDHGAPGLIAFPSKYLYADVLLKSFDKIKGNYQKIVFYLEVIDHLFRHANQDQCSKNYLPTLKSMLFPQLIPQNHPGEHTVVPTISYKENTLALALEIFSVLTLLKISIKQTITLKLLMTNSKSLKN